MSKFVSPETVATTLKVSVGTITKWARLGIVPSDKNRNIPEADFESWLASENGTRIQDFIDRNHRSSATEAELVEMVVHLELHA